MPFGLKENIIKKINAVFSSFPQVEEAVIYGSRAKGNYKPGSDIDIALKGNDLSLKELNKISLMIDDLLLPYHCDLSIFSHISNPDLIDHIDRIGKTLYKKNSEF
jgi:uncharacterized protein